MLEILKKYFFHKRSCSKMSILDKLKELVATIEEEVTTPEAQETPQEQEEVPQEEPESFDDEFPHYVECGKEESRDVYEKLLSVKVHKSQLAELIIEYDRKKKEHLAAINSLNQQAVKPAKMKPPKK